MRNSWYKCLSEDLLQICCGRVPGCARVCENVTHFWRLFLQLATVFRRRETVETLKAALLRCWDLLSACLGQSAGAEKEKRVLKWIYPQSDVINSQNVCLLLWSFICRLLFCLLVLSLEICALSLAGIVTWECNTHAVLVTVMAGAEKPRVKSFVCCASRCNGSMYTINLS